MLKVPFSRFRVKMKVMIYHLEVNFKVLRSIKRGSAVRSADLATSTSQSKAIGGDFPVDCVSLHITGNQTGK